MTEHPQFSGSGRRGYQVVDLRVSMAHTTADMRGRDGGRLRLPVSGKCNREQIPGKPFPWTAASSGGDPLFIR